MLQGAQIYREILDRLPGALLMVNQDFVVEWRNSTSESLIPQLTVGASLYEGLASAANGEKLDRLLLRGEMVMFSAGPELPLLEWLINDGSLGNGNKLLMVWNPALNDEMVERRAAFSMAAAHELRSPLTALIGFAEILDMERDNLNPAQIEAIEIIHTNALYLQSLVSDTLDLTSNSFGELTLELEWIELEGPVLEVTECIRNSAESRGQTITVEIESGVPKIEADARRLRQIIQNLVQNASTHTPSGTAINVSVEVKDDGVLIAVEDDGRGIPFDPPELAFGSFRHGGAVSFGMMTGSGIGLSITKRLVELHRGKISAKSSPAGSRFEVWLPFDRVDTFTRTPPGPA
ncbi:MAG: HAMP domain-containing sensor histidine kinase [Solirubrobacterales bacterium]